MLGDANYGRYEQSGIRDGIRLYLCELLGGITFFMKASSSA